MAKWGSFLWGDAILGGDAFLIPITDRTAADVTYAKAHPEATQDLKGAFNVSDHQRIKANLALVAETTLPLLGYHPGYIDLADVVEGDLSSITDLNILEANLKAIEDCGVTLPEDWQDFKTWVSGGANPNYTDANRWELDPYLIYQKWRTQKRAWAGYNYGGSGNLELLRGYNL